MDAVQKANSGHPGMPMGMADIAKYFGMIFYNIIPTIRNGLIETVLFYPMAMASMLLYAFCIYLAMILAIDDIKQFRQLHSKTPGHPELGIPLALKPLPAL